MPVPWRGIPAEVGITGLFWIRLSSGPVFHSKSGSLCHPAHWGVTLSQQDILPPQHHPHPVSTRRLFIPRKGTKPICFYSKPDLSVGSLILIIIQVLPQYSYRQPCHWHGDLLLPHMTDYLLLIAFLFLKLTFAFLTAGLTWKSCIVILTWAIETYTVKPPYRLRIKG